jgi:hypothetical protein
MRAFRHESVYILRWATETVLLLDYNSVPLVEQGQLHFLTQQVLWVLQNLTLFQRLVDDMHFLNEYECSDRRSWFIFFFFPFFFFERTKKKKQHKMSLFLCCNLVCV